MNEEKFLTEKDLAKRWKISHYTLQHQRWLNIGPNYLKIKGFVRYRLSDIKNYEDKIINSKNSKTNQSNYKGEKHV